jgi:serine/threonine protein kinase
VSLAPGQVFARYTLDRELGHGGMGRVYLATDSVLKRKVALKVLLPERSTGEAAQRFAREASLGAQVSHPNLVAVYDYGQVDGLSFIAMEYVEGTTLSAFVHDRTVPYKKRLDWLLDVARGLAEAHDHGLVHRDIKPANVMVTRSGSIKVLDFGLAKTTSGQADPNGFQTLEGRALGTPRYMAPEQLRGEPVSARTDQYGLGVLAFELLTGVHPSGPSGRDDPPKLVSELDRRLPFRLAVLVARLLAKKPDDRYPSMHDVSAELERLLHDAEPEMAPRETSPDAQVRTHEDLAVATARPGQVPVSVPVHMPSTAAPLELARRETVPLGSPAVMVAPASTLVSGQAFVAESAEPPPNLARIPAGKTLPSAGSEPPKDPNETLRSADAERPLGHVVDEAARRVLEGQVGAAGPGETPGGHAASKPAARLERLAEPVVVIPSAPPPSLPPTAWSKGMWLTVLAVGIVGVVAGAVLAAWALGDPAPAAGQPASGPSASVVRPATPPSARTR